MENSPYIGMTFGRNNSPIRYTILDIKSDNLVCQFTDGNKSGNCEMSIDYFNKGFGNSQRFVCY
ncbi:MAG: hypothetical protein J6X18_07430 [Bacteroidales bacterium]|nr:hypothetical protein [Bacteroidales bacterium]